MDCAEIQKLLSEYIDGTLDAKSVQMVERHVSVCKDCKETLASLSALVEELNTLEQVKPPADF
jgi:anti-sigma factor RsiW